MTTKARQIANAQTGSMLEAFFPPHQPLLAESRLTTAERHAVVDSFIVLLEGLYVHLPLKRAMYGKDPVQRLRLLRQRAADISEHAFHNELSMILTELRDAHTRYVRPDHLKGHVAVLPFMVETYGPIDDARYIVSNITEDDPAFAGSFGEGAEIVWWNGVPVARAVERYADQETGGRPDARRARALESLTFRALQYGPPPDEYWVQIGYRPADRPRAPIEEVRVVWRVVDVSRREEETTAEAFAQLAFASDPAAETVRRAKKLLFAPTVWYEHQRQAASAVDTSAVPETGEWITGTFQDSVAAKVEEVNGRKVGYLRLWSFDLIDDDGFIAEVIDLLGMLPQDGLIIDLRGNPGGLIWAAERLLQLFTPHEITPTQFSLLATDVTRVMAEAPQNQVQLEPWRRSLREAVANGEPYSRSVPLTPPQMCNNLGQYYGGPVVAVVDANTYSAGDLFAAGFVDNRVGTLVSIGVATGAGGANVWSPVHVNRALAGTGYDRDPLPQGIGYTLSFRRALRSGGASGVVIEDMGVPGHFQHRATKDDLIHGNRDLVAFCAALLASETVTNLGLVRTDVNRAQITPRGLDRVDIYVDDRPTTWLAVADEPRDIELDEGWASLRVEGFVGQTLVQRRRLER